jgi:hypothetical protein
MLHSVWVKICEVVFNWHESRARNSNFLNDWTLLCKQTESVSGFQYFANGKWTLIICFGKLFEFICKSNFRFQSKLDFLRVSLLDCFFRCWVLMFGRYCCAGWKFSLNSCSKCCCLCYKISGCVWYKFVRTYGGGVYCGTEISG